MFFMPFLMFQHEIYSFLYNGKPKGIPFIFYPWILYSSPIFIIFPNRIILILN